LIRHGTKNIFFGGGLIFAVVALFSASVSPILFQASPINSGSHPN
jgi:hypothetical protein